MKIIDLLSLIMTIAIVIAAIFFIASTDAEGEEITLTWDQPEQKHEGVKIFQKTAKDDDLYDFTAPVADVKYPDNYATIDVPGESDLVLKYMWVARAYRGEIESIDSNEVNYKVVNIPPLTPVELTGSYDISNQIISLAWEQPPDDWEIYNWIVYYRIPGGDWVELGQVDGSSELTLTQQLNIVNPGDQQTIDFAVVAFRRSGVFSANSVEHTITIDRREVAPINNLRIEIDIPI